MPTYVFTGKVLPERAAVSITLPRVHTFIPEAKLEFDAVVRITLSQVSVVVKTTEQTDDLPTLRNYVDDVVRIALDSYGYLEGRGYELEITSVVSPSGDALTVFGVEIPEIHQSKSERPVDL